MKLEDYDFSRIEKPGVHTARIAAEAKVLLRIVEGAGVALYRPTDDSPAELLIPRPDLFQYTGGYAWGYSGTGVQNLCHAIVGKVYEFDQLDKGALYDKAVRLLELLVSVLPRDSDHDVSVSEIKRILA